MYLFNTDYAYINYLNNIGKDQNIFLLAADDAHFSIVESAFEISDIIVDEYVHCFG